MNYFYFCGGEETVTTILHSSQLTLSSISAQEAHLLTDLAESQPAGGTY